MNAEGEARRRCHDILGLVHGDVDRPCNRHAAQEDARCDRVFDLIATYERTLAEVRAQCHQGELARERWRKAHAEDCAAYRAELAVAEENIRLLRLDVGNKTARIAADEEACAFIDRKLFLTAASLASMAVERDEAVAKLEHSSR